MFQITGSLNAYLGDFAIQAHADNGSRFLEGETRGYNGYSVALKTAYNYKDWQFALVWQQPLASDYKISKKRPHCIVKTSVTSSA